MTDGTRLAEYFAELTEELARTSDEPLTFETVARRATQTVPGCDGCGITLRTRRGGAESVAATDDDVRQADALQYSLEEGPCLDSTLDRENLVVADLRSEQRWSRWSAQAADLGLRSVFSVALWSQDETIGALNLYGREPHAYDDEQRLAVASIFAVHAAVAMRRARLVSGLRIAMESRHTIGMAQGVLAVVYHLSFEAAFEVLHRYSNDTNTPLRDVAQHVLDHRELPDLVG